MHWNKLLPVIILPIMLSFLLGRIMIPIFRKYRTGKLEIYIGDRFKTDDSEPAFGGLSALTVFVFALVLAAAACGETSRLAMSAVFVAVITVSGIIDDCMTDIYKKPYGLKSGIRLGYIFSACLLFLLWLNGMGLAKTQILLPFRLGYLELGNLYFPIAAVVMTAVIYAFSYHNRFGVDESSCCGGLCAVTAFLIGLGISVSGNILSDNAFSAYGTALSATAMGSLIWGLSPSKLRYGASGGYFFGGAIAAAAVFCPYMLLGVLLAAVGAIADSVCTAVAYLIYKHFKKLILKGSSLHAHFKAKGMNDYRIIIIFGIITTLGCAAQIAFTVYAEKLN